MIGAACLLANSDETIFLFFDFTLTFRDIWSGRRPLIYPNIEAKVMTDKVIPLTHDFIQDLFKRADCLTFHWLNSNTAIEYKHNLWKAYNYKPCYFISKMSKFALSGAMVHFFSDGTLIYPYYVSNEYLKRFEKIVNAHGYNITQRL